MEYRTRLELANKMVKIGVIKDAMIYSDWIFVNLTVKEEDELLIKLYETESFELFND